MTDSLLDLLLPATKETKTYGVVVGIVTNNRDPDGMGRVKVRFPWMSDSNESYWARLATTMSGKDRGTYFLPEVEDEVLVAFEHGDVRFPYVLGALWNGQDPPPETNSDGENNIRLIKSRSGHVIRLQDKDGEERIEIVDKSGKNSFVINSADNTITISADADIIIQACSGKLKLSGSGIEIASQGAVKIEAGANIDLQASAQLNAKGQMINLN
jgi:uncharacterized protein involved in type VI secretion and phage assembly